MAKTKENHERGVRRCVCPTCRREPEGAIAQEHQAINRLVGFLAQRHGRGGIALLSRITGRDRNTVARGRRELYQVDLASAGRVRRPGAGRKRVEVASPEF